MTDRGKSKSNACTTSGHQATGYRVRRSGSVLELADCTSCYGNDGVRVLDDGMLTAHKVEVTGAAEDGFVVIDGGQAVLRECSATNCQENGIFVRDAGSRLDAESCTLQQVRECGALAETGAAAVMRLCHSSGNQISGYCAHFYARMKVRNSLSEGDEKDCAVRDGGELLLEGLNVDGVLKSGSVAEEVG